MKKCKHKISVRNNKMSNYKINWNDFKVKRQRQTKDFRFKRNTNINNVTVLQAWLVEVKACPQLINMDATTLHMGTEQGSSSLLLCHCCILLHLHPHLYLLNHHRDLPLPQPTLLSLCIFSTGASSLATSPQPLQPPHLDLPLQPPLTLLPPKLFHNAVFFDWLLTDWHALPQTKQQHNGLDSAVDTLTF